MVPAVGFARPPQKQISASEDGNLHLSPQACPPMEGDCFSRLKLLPARKYKETSSIEEALDYRLTNHKNSPLQ